MPESRNNYDDGLDDLDPYFTCPEAIASLIALEGDRLPRHLWENGEEDATCDHEHRDSSKLPVTRLVALY